jgi:hypothetical protein
MKVVNLHIHPELRGWLIDAIEDASVGLDELLIAKGPLNDEGPEAWSMTAIAREVADEMKKDRDYVYIRADGLVFLAVQPELIHELEGKFMDWCHEGPFLIDRA